MNRLLCTFVIVATTLSGKVSVIISLSLNIDALKIYKMNKERILHKVCCSRFQ